MDNVNKVKMSQMYLHRLWESPKGTVTQTIRQTEGLLEMDGQKCLKGSKWVDFKDLISIKQSVLKKQ